MNINIENLLEQIKDDIIRENPYVKDEKLKELQIERFTTIMEGFARKLIK